MTNLTPEQIINNWTRIVAPKCLLGVRRKEPFVIYDSRTIRRARWNVKRSSKLLAQGLVHNLAIAYKILSDIGELQSILVTQIPQPKPFCSPTIGWSIECD